MTARGYDFRKWIEAGYRDYGKDPWFFIRELAQNSRDAGAKSVWVKIGYTSAREEALVFEDDGRGMSYDHAVRYLFRLYASSKTNEKYAAGLFGIGFWTVLRFNPKKVIIESWNKKEQWGVEVDVGEDLTTTRTSGGLKHRGTRITLIRAPRETSPGEFSGKTRAALVRYCSYLRRNTRKAERLPVYFSGEDITSEMKLPGPVSMKFRTDFVEGAVGLGSQPRVQLYARGLPVWEGTSLEELSHVPPTQSAAKKQYQQEMGLGQGLAPVFLLNGYHLEVNISRKRVIDNRNLQKVRKTAENALAQMVEAAADSISPRGLLRQFLDTIKHRMTSVFRSFSKTLLVSLLVILPLEVILLRSFYNTQEKKTPITSFTLQADQRHYSGASVRVADTGDPLELSYHPDINTWFKLFTADEYHISSGFLQTKDEKEDVPMASLNCSQDSIWIELKILETGKIFLPQPVGFAVESSSLKLNRTPLTGVQYYPTGEVKVSIPSRGTIRYRCCPVETRELRSLLAAQQEKLVLLPEDFSLPESVERQLRNSVHLGIKDKVKTAIRLTGAVLKYDDSVDTAQKYDKFSESRDWFQKVSTIGAGDCDILNGVTTLFLRKMGVPAQLVVGFVGKKGNVLPGLHAWTEYIDNDNLDRGWNIVDTSVHIPRRSRVLTTPPAEKKEEPGVVRELPGIDSFDKGLPYKTVVNAFMLVLFFLLLLLFFLLYRTAKSRTPPFFQSQDTRQVQEDLAAMVLHELLYPGSWGRDGRIRNFKLIPTINNKQGLVSLQQALNLGAHRKLYTLADMSTGNGNVGAIPGIDAFLAHLKQAPVPILDSGNPAFAPLIKLLPGAVHLERIFALQVMVPGKVVQPVVSTADLPMQLLADVNQRLQSISRKIPLCVLGPGLVTSDFLDVDLSELPSLEKWGIPKKFIAINPNSRRMKNLVRLYEENPRLAQFRLVIALIKESGLISYPSAAIIEKVTRKLVKLRINE